uniref:ATP synthase F0 subunit 8 n=1 Tax=Amblyomma argentinae TaxID=705545 RepID=UPI002E7894B8|nr:ATP synthase F0 subunit 8 [Amblyomma argentinae]WQF68968.1 ATP synthase F0 subunit 8 [Amblyomma argentinae]
MPQLFPMNWMLISPLILIMFLLFMMTIFFFKISNKIYFSKLSKENNKFLFKW